MKYIAIIRAQMTRLCFILFLAFALSSQAATSFTEFYVKTTGSNLNAGSDTNDAAALTFVGATFVNATGVLTLTGADLSAVTTNQWISIYTGAATLTGYSGQIIAVDDALDIITVSSAAGRSGTYPNDGTYTCKVGGAWKGPNSAVYLPFDFLATTATNRLGNKPRGNIVNGITYTTTGTITSTTPGVRFQGYTATPGDGGRATIASSGTASYVMMASNNVNQDYEDLIFDGSSFTSGTSAGVTVASSECLFRRVVIHHTRGSSIVITASITFDECEFYAAGSGAVASAVSCTSGNGWWMYRTFIHDNTNGNGVSTASTATIDRCVIETNARNGVSSSGTTLLFISNTDFYGNLWNGIDLVGASASYVRIENNNFFNTTTNAIASTTSAILNGSIVNNAFGTGTAANGGNIATWITTRTGVDETGSISYAANLTPWTAPTTGDFRILSTAVGRAAGRGSFTQTAPSYTGTVGYPDIGAAQSITNASGGSGGAYPFVQ